MKMGRDITFIWGKELLINELMYENKNEIDTLKFIDDDSELNLKNQFDKIGSALSLLSQIASCAWGCSKGNHIKENLVRRLTNYCFATIRLTNLGLYNESFSLIRSAGELANILQLFSYKAEEFDKWVNLSSKERWDNFKPEKIRTKLKSFSIPEIMDKETYSELCGIAIHPSIEFAGVSHQETGNVYIGSEFSKQTIVIIYNELTNILSQILGCVGDFIRASNGHKKILVDASQSLADLKSQKLNFPRYLKQIEKDGFAKLSLDSSRINEFLSALLNHNIYFIATNKPKNLTEMVNEKGSASVNIYSAEINGENIIPIFTTERKAKAFITLLNEDEQRICKELKLVIRPILENTIEAKIILNYQNEFEREITNAEIEQLKALMEKENE